MALYLGQEKLTPFPNEMSAWWSGVNPEFLYEANVTYSLN